MNILQTILSNWAPPVGVLALIVLLLFIAQRFLGSGRPGRDGSRYRVQLLSVAIGLVGVLALVLVLPLSSDLKGQLLSLIGILLSAAVALSSTTVLGNALAGLMIRFVRGFRIGDFIQVNEHFGRVTERGLFHVEVQTEQRELTTFPNLYLVKHPLTTVRSSGTVVTAQVSLGYDVPRSQVEALLKKAAEETGLEDPFVHVVDLGDFSVTYRIAGLLAEVKGLITARSRLRAAVMDALHEGGVEIVSPTFLYRRSAEGRDFIPEADPAPRPIPDPGQAEDVVFEKAEAAESREERIHLLTQRLGEIEAELGKDVQREETERLKGIRERIRGQLEGLAKESADQED